MDIADISSDDPDLAEILLGLKKETYSPANIASDGPARFTKIHAEMANGRLVASYCGTRRFVTAIDYAKWLLLMRRESAASDRAQTNRTMARERRLKTLASGEAA